MGGEKLKKKLKIKDGEKIAKGYDLKKRKMKKKEKNEPKKAPLLENEEKSHDLKEERETAKGSEKKRKSVKNRKNFEGEQANHLNYEADKSMEEGRGKKRKLVRHKKTKNEEVIEADIDEVIEPSDAMVDSVSAKNFPVEVGEKKRSKTMKRRKDRKTKKAEQQVVGLDNELETKNEELFEADIDGIEELSDAMKNYLNGQNFTSETREKNNRSKSRLKKRTKEADEQIVELQNEFEDDYNKQAGKSKKTLKFKRKGTLLLQSNKVPARTEEADQNVVYEMSSGDEDCSKGMKKWIMEYHQSQPGLEVLQERIDDFITAHEEQLEQERKEREARAAEGGWTVVVHHKGRKKTTESESGIVVGSVAQAVVTEKLAKKKTKEVGLDFYRFQKRDAHRNEIRMLQSKFEQDKKRVQQMRAERKFRPY